jgi:anaerobic selenocysteine-containing dehydrogenase
MKVDRRSFLSLIIGGAAGTALTPLPWKLTDDLSIWSQNWPWTPVPLNGEVTHVKTTCTLCPGGCGVSVRKIDNRAVKIEGIQGHPINDGGICILGVSGLQLLYGPTRVKTPLKRIGERGAGHWQPISWNQAITEVSEKLGAIRTKGEPHTVACISGSDQGTIPQLFSRFMQVYGSPNFICPPTFAEAYQLALYMTQGTLAVPGFDLENADCVLSFGSGIIDGWGSPVRMFRANSLWKEKQVKVVQIEPRLSNSAAKADQWVPINPGTEADLALGIAQVMIAKNMYHAHFVNNYATGFEQWKKILTDNFAPESVAAITGVDIQTITQLAETFARASRPIALCGRGQGRTLGELRENLAVHCLNALAGNIGQPGGVWAVPEPDYINWPEPQTDSIAAASLQKGRLDGAGSSNYPATRYLLHRFIKAVAAGEGYPISALLINDANPCYCQPDSESVKAAFDKIPLVVSFSSFMDETAAQADLILPDHTNLESHRDVPVFAGLNKPIIGLTQPAVTPQFDTQSVGDTVIKIAKSMGGFVAEGFAWADYPTCLAETLADQWQTLTKKGVWTDDLYRPRAWSDGFETASTKFEFSNRIMDAVFGGTKIDPAGDIGIFPLLLVPYDSMRLANGYIGDPPFMVKSVADTVLKARDGLIEIHPDTARKAGLSDGQKAVLSTPLGQAKVKVHLFEGILPGVLAMPRGLGHTAYDKYLAHKGVNVNDLIGSLGDPASGLDAAWGIRAKLSKA